jgi:hypothetical protein
MRCFVVEELRSLLEDRLLALSHMSYHIVDDRMAESAATWKPQGEFRMFV